MRKTGQRWVLWTQFGSEWGTGDTPEAARADALRGGDIERYIEDDEPDRADEDHESLIDSLCETVLLVEYEDEDGNVWEVTADEYAEALSAKTQNLRDQAPDDLPAGIPGGRL